MSSHVGIKQQERRIIEEKIAKVREVVRNVTTNDIVLALHSHDMDVEAAIRAFCEGGTSVALGEWEQPTNKQKGRQAAKKAAKRQVPSPFLSSSVAGSVSANGTGTNKSPSNTKTSSTANSVVNGYTCVASVHRSGTGVNGHLATPPPLLVASSNLSGPHPPKQPTVAAAAGVAAAAANKQSKKPTGGSGGGRGSDNKRNRNQHGIDVTRPLARTHTNQTALNEGIDAKVNAIRDDATQHLSNYAGEMELLEHNFHTMMNQSEEALGLCFRQIQQCVAEREQQLRAELAKCRNSGASIYIVRRAALAALQSKAASLTNHSQHGDVEKWIEEWETFNREKSAERELVAAGDRLTIDVKPLLAAIRHLGQVASIDSKRSGETPYGSKPATQSNNCNNGTKPAADQHSSSVKEVEKTPHISNGSQGRAAEIMKPEDNISQNGIPANGSGIVMHSEALSYEELAALQRQIEETLKAQGIDPSVLADTSLLASASAPPRRRAPNSSSNNNQGGGSRAAKHTNTESGNYDKTKGPKNGGGHPPPPSSASSRNHTHRKSKK